MNLTTNPIRDIIIRPFVPTPENYTRLAQLRNAIWADESVSPTQLQHDDTSWPADYFFRRRVVEMDGQLIAATHCFENHWQYQPGKYDLEILVHPDFQGRGIGSALYEQIVQELRARTPPAVSLVSGTREDKAAALRFLERRGFVVSMRWARSVLTVADFDTTAYAKLRKRLAAEGIAIYSMAELTTQDPHWQRKAYELDLIAGQDAPSPDPKSEVSFEQYVENTFNHPGFLPKGCFVAVGRDGGWSGLTELSRTDQPDVLNTPWTSVHPDYRRRGLATALKVQAIGYAQQNGIRAILAANEANNPMYQINLALGFQPLPATLTMKKQFVEPNR